MRETAADRGAAWVLLFGLTAAGGVRAQEPPRVEEQVEIREVGVVADLDTSYRGLSGAQLESRLLVLEDGNARKPTSVSALAVPGRASYSRVVVAFDSEHCDETITAAGAAAAGSEADQLVALGPVDVMRAGDHSEYVLRGEVNAAVVAKAASTFVRDACPGKRKNASIVPQGLDPGECEAKPCLLVWVGGGWGEDPAAVDAAKAELDQRIRSLATGGWVVLAAPIARAEPKVEGPTVKPPEHLPGTDRYTFGMSVFGGKKKEKLTEEEYATFVDLWLAPLRRLADATAGEVATNGEELALALDAVGRRSILWYRAERAEGAPAPRLEVRETAGTIRRLPAPEWAPSLRK